VSKGDHAKTMTYESESQIFDEEILRVIQAWHERGEVLDDERFSDFALRLFAYQLRYNEPYARYCARLGISGSSVPRSWEAIPAVPSTAFKEAAVATFDPSDAALSFETSGTTGARPGRHSMQTATLYDAALLAAFDRLVLPAGARLRYFNCVPNPSDRRTSSLGYMMQRIALCRGDGRTGWYVSGARLDVDGVTRDLRAAIDENQPVFLAATAFALVRILDAMQSRGIRLQLPRGSRVLETGGFKGRTRNIERPVLYARIAEFLGVKEGAVVSEYGMTELTSQYYGVAKDRRYVGPPWLRARVVGPDRATLPRGSVGSLLHVDLANRSSCIAIQTDDLGVEYDDGFALIGREPDADPRGCSLDAEDLKASTTSA
jgi:hypothetical protein